MDQGPPHKARYTESDRRGSGGIALNSLALETTFWTGHPQLAQALETIVNTWGTSRNWTASELAKHTIVWTEQQATVTSLKMKPKWLGNT
jgi:hypothetical protein